jgi:acyl carrier protein phosphodiesterase
MGRRVRRPNPLAEGILDLDQNHAGLAADFAEFMADAAQFAARWR